VAACTEGPAMDALWLESIPPMRIICWGNSLYVLGFAFVARGRKAWGFTVSGGVGYVCIYLPIEGADSLKRFGSCKLGCRFGIWKPWWYVLFWAREICTTRSPTATYSTYLHHDNRDIYTFVEIPPSNTVQSISHLPYLIAYRFFF